MGREPKNEESKKETKEKISTIYILILENMSEASSHRILSNKFSEFIKDYEVLFTLPVDMYHNKINKLMYICKNKKDKNVCVIVFPFISYSDSALYLDYLTSFLESYCNSKISLKEELKEEENKDGRKKDVSSKDTSA